MKSVELIDIHINEKLNELDKLPKYETHYTDILRVAILDHIGALLWVMDALDFALLPEQTKQRIEAIKWH